MPSAAVGSFRKISASLSSCQLTADSVCPVQPHYLLFNAVQMLTTTKQATVF